MTTARQKLPKAGVSGPSRDEGLFQGSKARQPPGMGRLLSGHRHGATSMAKLTAVTCLKTTLEDPDHRRIAYINWSPNSPNLNLVESVWQSLKAKAVVRTQFL